MIPIELICSTFVFSSLLLGSSDSRPIAWCIVGAFAGLFIFYKGFLLLQERHLIFNTPASKIRSASLGMVELTGLAAGPYTVVAPIAGRACYYYRTEAWEWKQSGRNKTWVKVAAECMHVPFFLDDNTGKVMVDPRGAELDLHRDFQQEFCDGFFTTKQEALPHVHSFLLRHGVSTRNKMKVEEFCIKPKNAMFVLGTLEENPGIVLTSQPIQDLEFSTHTIGLSFSLGGSQSSFPGSSLGLGNSITGFGLSGKSSARSEDRRQLEALSNNSPPAKLARPPAASFAGNAPGGKIGSGHSAFAHVWPGCGRGDDSAAKNCGCTDESWNRPSRHLGGGRWNALSNRGRRANRLRAPKSRGHQRAAIDRF